MLVGHTAQKYREVDAISSDDRPNCVSDVREFRSMLFVYSMLVSYRINNHMKSTVECQSKQSLCGSEVG